MEKNAQSGNLKLTAENAEVKFLELPRTLTEPTSKSIMTIIKIQNTAGLWRSGPFLIDLIELINLPSKGIN